MIGTSKIFIVFATIFVVTACGNETVIGEQEKEITPIVTARRLDVITTIYPVTYFSERVGGDQVRVTSFAQVGADPHSFDPSPSDIIKIGQSDVLIYAHRDFEMWIPDAVDASGNNSIVALEASGLLGDFAVTRIEGDEPGGESDPHTWLNPLNAITMVRGIESVFVAADPSGADEFKQNADRLEADLTLLDSQIAESIHNCSLDTVVVSHLAYGHMAERYGFTQLGLAGLSHGYEVSPNRVVSTVEEILELGIKYIMQEPGGDGRLARMVAEQIGGSILELHPLESLSADDVLAGRDYMSIMRRNAQVLSQAMGCQ